MTIGIITMHRVLNHGSALQAYALQQKLSKMGYESDIIDYVYPYEVKQHSRLKNLLESSLAFFRDAAIGFQQHKKRKKFRLFRSRNFALTKKQYSKDSISIDPPLYDLYITGSDQVWNPRFIDKDVNFMLAFTHPKALKISYASSIATTSIGDDIKGLYSKYLSRYYAISVREQFGVNLIRELTGKDAVLCCDPTLLLDKEDWGKLANQSKYNIKYKYILVYALYYMFDPYPYIYRIVEKVQKQLGYKVIYLVGKTQDFFRRNSTLIKSAGPEDFLYLFRNAEFVITTSFHGAAFALINDKPLMGIVDSASRKDSRLQSLLESVSAQGSIFDYKEDVDLDASSLLRLKGDQEALANFVARSELYLKNNLRRLDQIIDNQS